MKKTQLSSTVSVSFQIEPKDLQALKDAGIEIVVCNRPDGEAISQASFEEIKKMADILKINAIHIPFAGDEMNDGHVDALRTLIQSGKKIHAYCRTGNRSTALFQAATLTSKSIKTNQTEKEIPSQVKAILHFDIVIVGAGSAGIAVASSLLKRKPTLRLALIDPSKEHYYQPGWTLVGAGVFTDKATKRNTSDLIPKGATWINETVKSFCEEEDYVSLCNNNNVHYSHLVIAAGLKLDWDKIEGLEETLGKNGVTSNYRYDLAPYTWKLVQNLEKGVALFTQPPMPIKCAGAPQKALYLSADYWFKNNLIPKIGVHFYNAGGVLFGVDDYVPALSEYIEKYQAELHFSHTLVKVDGNAKKAWFKISSPDGSESTISTHFDMIHVCPSQSAPDAIQESRLSDHDGWLDVDKHTLQHVRIKNIWGLGDATNSPNAKTMAAARKQAPVVAINICDAIDSMPPSASYDGYGSCPLTVERGKIVLAEFTYGGKLSPSFPAFINNGTRPTKLAWLLKVYILPFLYWQGMLKGREWLARPQSQKGKA